jgi:altered-inheritance-of-mitochondria protein 5
VDRAKDKGNADVQGAVRWLQGADWNRARERVEERVGLLAEATGAEEAVGRVAAVAQAKGAEARRELGGMVESGLAKARDAVEDVGSLVVGGAGAGVGEVEDGVKKALRQRYERAAAGTGTKTVSEVLQERYIPMDKRDNTVLRGI